MPLEKRSFMGGMNKDGDVRLIKNPDYIDALNVRAATSVDGTIGSLENIEGNVEVPFEFYSTDPETFFVNDNGLYEEINPGTVFYQKVIRIQGWEQANQAYNFSLFSVGPNGNVLIGEFNWNGNNGHTFTSFYLNSQFSSVGPFNSGINVYEVNSGNQFTASVKLLSFGQNSMLHGGYFDIVIECDTPGVNFNLSVSSNVDSDSLIYTYDEEQTGIPISVSENLSVFLLPGFESGGVFNTDANDDGVVVSPDGTLYEVGNRTVWRISFIAGEEPTSPTGFDEVTIYSYRDNLNPGDETFEFEFESFLTIDASTFSSGEFQFDSGQNKLSAFLHDQFSESKSVLCDGLPLNFNIDPDKFFLTFSENATFDGTNDFSIIVVGPVGVRFKLALADSSENLMVALQPNNELTDGESDFATIFGNGTIALLQNYQIIQNSIEITNSIVNSFTVLQEELENAIQNFYNLEQISIQQNIDNNILQSDLEAQILLTNEANQELADTEANLVLANQALSDANSTITTLGQANDYLQESNDAMLIDIASLNADLDEVNDQLNQVQAQLNIAQGNLADEQDLTAQQAVTIATLDAEIVSLGDAIIAINVAHGGTLAALEAELGGEIETLQSANDNLQSLLDSTNNMISVYIQDMADQDDAHANLVAEMGVTHQAQIDQLIADHNQALADAEDADQAAQDALQADFDADLAALTADHLAAVAALEATISGQSAQISSQGNTILNLQSTIQELNETVEELQAQLDELRISDAIIVAKLNEYNDTYTSLSDSYSQALTIYNALSLENQVIYQPGMNILSEFQGDFILYEGLFTDTNDLSILSSTDASGNIVNPSGSEINGGLILPLSSSLYTAVRLPYSSFTNQGAWQNGNEISITIMFNSSDVGTGPGSSNIPSNLDLIITNLWDDSDEWMIDANSDYGFEVTLPLNTTGNTVFEHTFTVTDTNESNFLNRWANITIIIPQLIGQQANDFQIMLTQIRISNDAQEAIDFNLANNVPEAEENYLNMYNDVNTEVLSWQDSGIDTLEEFIGTPQFGISYQQILLMTIRGYSETASSNSTIGGRLQAYADAVFNFSNAVQNQVYNAYVNYFQASQANPEDLVSLQEQHAADLAVIQNQLETAQQLVISLQNEIVYLSDNSGAFLTGPNIGATLVTFVGTDTTSISTGAMPFSPYSNTDHKLVVKYMVDGNLEVLSEILLLSASECYALANQPHSETNNIVYYLTNRFQNGQTLEFQLPDIYGYPTQTLIVLLANFNEETSTVGDQVPFLAAVNGIDITQPPWNGFITNPDELFQHRDIQMIFYFDQTQFDNVPATENFQFVGLYGASAGDMIAADFMSDAALFANTARYTTITAF